MKVYVTGDTHIPYDIHKLNKVNFPEGSTLTKKDIVIVLGDFGLIWYGENSKEAMKEEKWWTNRLDNKPWTTMFVDGNHENFDRLKLFPTATMYGGKVGVISKSIFHMHRGEIFNIAGKKILTFGGAESTDKQHRREFTSWWKDEIPNYAEMLYCFDNAIKHKPDFILSHTCPASIIPAFIPYTDILNDPVSIFFDKLAESYPDFENWYFGHMHKDITYKNYRCCYNDIIRII